MKKGASQRGGPRAAGRREAGVAEDSDGLPAPVYGFAFSNEDDDEPACGVKPKANSRKE